MRVMWYFIVVLMYIFLVMVVIFNNLLNFILFLGVLQDEYI